MALLYLRTNKTNEKNTITITEQYLVKVRKGHILAIFEIKKKEK